ncbi:MAG: 2-hydroxyacyl-CoA dehydratase [Gammaproteobacteria bacterium]|nr:2-hydroxyacyl-CoA dehydratase [Gammaproteobacteria bacterium]
MNDVNESDSALALRAARALRQQGGKVIGFVGGPVPFEPARAMDVFPLPLKATPAPHDCTAIDDWIDDKEDPLISSVFGRMVAGELELLDGLVVTRRYDYLYYGLREILRQGLGRHLPPLHIHDLMPIPGDGALLYNRRSVQRLMDFIGRVCGRGVDDDALRYQIGQTNDWNATLRTLSEARRAGRISGSAAVTNILAGQFVNRDQGNELIAALLRECAEGDASTDTRIMLVTSQPLEDAGVHRAVESAGVYIVAEDDGTGMFCVPAPMNAGDDPVTSLAAWYGQGIPQQLAHPLSARMTHVLQIARSQSCTVVVFLIDPRDTRLGWDFPPMRDQLRALGVDAIQLNFDYQTPEGLVAATAALRDLNLSATACAG